MSEVERRKNETGFPFNELGFLIAKEVKKNQLNSQNRW